MRIADCGGDSSTPSVSSIPSLSLFAGNGGGAGSADGTGAVARFNSPFGVATDSADNVYVTDTTNNIIRKITPAGVVSTVAGTTGGSGSADGTGVLARFNHPAGVATDSADNVYVADTTNNTIRKITSAGVVTTLAGSPGASGSTDGTGVAAHFKFPQGVATDSAGNVYVANAGNSTIRKITPAGVVSTLAGTADSVGSADGTGEAARFNHPTGIATDSAGNVYVTDTKNNTIRKITPAGVVSTLAGTAGSAGSADGTGAAASFNGPFGVATDNADNVYVTDTANNTLRKITPAGIVSTLAGTAGSADSADGTGAAARFNHPIGVVTDSAGNVYVADTGNNTIRKITPAGVVSTLAGTASVTGSTDDTDAAARFNRPFGVATDSAGNVYVTDTTNSTIRKITPAGVVSTLAGTADSVGSADGTGAAARFNESTGVATDSAGNVYVADAGNSNIRKITPTGVVTTLAGTAGVTGSTDGTGAVASFNEPTAVATDSAGNVYVADTTNSIIRKITPAGVVSTLAGAAGSAGSADGTGTAARFNEPTGVTTDSADNVYVADAGNSIIRKITPAGVVTTLAGTAGSVGSADGTGEAASFIIPFGVATDSADNVYVADIFNNTIRKITPAGVVSTLVGTAGRSGFSPGPLPAVITAPSGIALSGTTIYFSTNNAIAKVTQ